MRPFYRTTSGAWFTRSSPERPPPFTGRSYAGTTVVPISRGVEMTIVDMYGRTGRSHPVGEPADDSAVGAAERSTDQTPIHPDEEHGRGIETLCEGEAR